jgi:hypothetical protein
MQSLSIRAWNHLGDPLHVAADCLQQATQILLGLYEHIASPQAEKRRIFPAERQESRSQLFQGAGA